MRVVMYCWYRLKVYSDKRPYIFMSYVLCLKMFRQNQFVLFSLPVHIQQFEALLSFSLLILLCCRTWTTKAHRSVRSVLLCDVKRKSESNFERVPLHAKEGTIKNKCAVKLRREFAKPVNLVCHVAVINERSNFRLVSLTDTVWILEDCGG